MRDVGERVANSPAQTAAVRTDRVRERAARINESPSKCLSCRRGEGGRRREDGRRRLQGLSCGLPGESVRAVALLRRPEPQSAGLLTVEVADERGEGAGRAVEEGPIGGAAGVGVLEE